MYSRRPILIWLTAILWPVTGAFAQLTLVDSAGPDNFVLYDGKMVVPLLVETNNDRAVLRAADDFAEDISRVTGLKPPMATNTDATPNLIIAGTLGQSPLLDRLAAEGKIKTDGVRGGWECYTIQSVDNPLPGVTAALVIAGSDKRGTIYGLYQVSEFIGVSPWYWWADVPPRKKDFVAFRKGTFQQGPPAVKYRGIFLNDEDWGLRPWAAQTFEPEAGNIGPKTYAKIFELLLRLRANYIWPAMHPGTPAFNANPTNKDLAGLYGIVMGSSHCEQMLRDNIDEWKPEKNGEYDYTINRTGVLSYWEQRVRENAAYESTYTVGMRGISDGAMPGGGTLSEKAARLLDIIKDQRSLLARWVNTNVSTVPQIFCPYKEVLDLYRLAPNIPSDITLLWPDDNYGYVRQFSDERERARPGGAGVYYHVSYWGRPEDYLWLCSTPPALIGEEMSKAYDYGANTVWIVNVGDLKPAEMDIEFFLRLAWNPHLWNAGNTFQLMEQQFARDFGPEYAPEIGAIFAEYNRLNFARKPEHMDMGAKEIFSIGVNGDESEQRLEAWRELEKDTVAVAQKLPPEMRDAYYELIGYPVSAAEAMNQKWLGLSRYQYYSRMGQSHVVNYLEDAQMAQRRMDGFTQGYNRAAKGKWAYIMSDQPREQPVFAFPKMPAPASSPKPARLGLLLEGSNQAVFANTNGDLSTNPLPQFNRLTRRRYFVDVLDGGTRPLAWKLRTGSDWIKLRRGTGGGEARVWVDIDWTLAPHGDNVTGYILFSTTNQGSVVEVNVYNPADLSPMRGADFVEDDHHLIAQAAHASAFVPGEDAHWEVITGLGYNGSSVSVFPATAAIRALPSKILAESPRLEYKFWMQHPGDWHFNVRALPTFSVETGQPQRYAIALDDEAPKVVSIPVSTSETDRRWQEDVLRNAAITSSLHPVAQAGLHTLKIWMVDPGIVIDTIAADDGSSQDPGYLWPPETRPILK